MGAAGRILVIGSRELADQATELLPSGEFVAVDLPLPALWPAGQRAFDAALVAHRAGEKLSQLVRNLRPLLHPRARIVVACTAADEPTAHQAIADGADDYLLLPLHRGELEATLRLPPSPSLVTTGTIGSPASEIDLLAEIVRGMDTGVAAMLERFATFLMHSFQSTGALIILDGLTVRCGEATSLVLQEPILRRNQSSGVLALGPAQSGAYSAAAARRLTDYAVLIELLARQVSERDAWRELAWRDDLCGLHNRRYFDRRLDELLERCVTDRLQLTVLLFDIDDFKRYNDRFGHETGDRLLREVAELLRSCTRDHDIIARYGGDEFAVIFWESDAPRVPGSRHPTEVRVLTSRFCQAIADHSFRCLGENAPGPVTISGGLASFPWDGGTRIELLRAADAALLEAKRIGKNRVALSQSEGRFGPADIDADLRQELDDGRENPLERRE